MNTENQPTYAVGDLVLLRYGNGTQAGRVARITRSGGLCVDRFLPACQEDGGGHWRPAAKSALRPDQLVGPLPATDPRRAMSGFRTIFGEPEISA